MYNLEIIIRMILDLQFINKFKISIMMILKALMEILFLFKEQRNKIWVIFSTAAAKIRKLKINLIEAGKFWMIDWISLNKKKNKLELMEE